MKKSSEVLTKEQILLATEETLRRFGVAKTSVTDVAKVLNVSHGTIYRHFKNKKEILEAATEMWLDERILKPLTDVYEKSSMKGAERVRAYVQKLIELKRYYAREDEELFNMYAKVTNEATELINRHIGHILEQIRDMIIGGGIDSGDPAQLARSIFYATARYHHPAHAYEWKRDTIDQEFNDVWELLEKGFL
ncbi:TetR family transcriptional regulator [Metabacillus arenae]|uniref:TetR family transcriptional regulator n=1 Tax=Metabacillus arenae TaxID=2771434 RepID=A0A926RYF4_9BACI|nr:TetR family transcriptional regulator [Metabacillus arenae]MBD1382021.1 TetR family transcriptional regulator [Metabacillus arenae]